MNGGLQSAQQKARNVAADALDEVMHSAEETLLVSRLLARHLASTLAAVHHLPVAVHPSQQHIVGATSIIPTKVNMPPQSVNPTQQVCGLVFVFSLCL